MHYSCIIVAAGSGTRMQLGYNKVFLLLDSKTVLEKTIDIFYSDERCDQIILVSDAEEYHKHIKNMYEDKMCIVPGGKSRQDSVQNGLKEVKNEIVLIHDGARPFLKKETLDAVIEKMKDADAACVMVDSKDTVKEVKDGYIVQTFDRSSLKNAQTPQAFKTALIIDCMRKAEEDGYQGTDDCSLVERYSDCKIAVVQGEYGNLKITTKEDIR